MNASHAFNGTSASVGISASAALAVGIRGRKIEINGVLPAQHDVVYRHRLDSQRHVAGNGRGRERSERSASPTSERSAFKGVGSSCAASAKPNGRTNHALGGTRPAAGMSDGRQVAGVARRNLSRTAKPPRTFSKWCGETNRKCEGQKKLSLRGNLHAAVPGNTSSTSQPRQNVIGRQTTTRWWLRGSRLYRGSEGNGMPTSIMGKRRQCLPSCPR